MLLERYASGVLVSLDEWRLLAASSVHIDPSVSTYDVIHVSRDIATDADRTRDWCLHGNAVTRFLKEVEAPDSTLLPVTACHEVESCVAVSLSDMESATRCILYPDTTICGLSSAPSSTSTCRLVIKEAASQVYLRTGKSTTTQTLWFWTTVVMTCGCHRPAHRPVTASDVSLHPRPWNPAGCCQGNSPGLRQEDRYSVSGGSIRPSTNWIAPF